MSSIQHLVGVLFAGCILSFVWGMQCFFRVDGAMPGGARLIQLLGAISLTGHLVALWLSGIPTVVSGMVGALLYVLALVMFWTAISANWEQPLTAAFSVDAPRHITSHGPYRVVRHPVYSSYLCAWVAGVIATNEAWLLLTLLAMGSVYYAAARKEEAKFTRGPLAGQYRRYQSRTGMFVPWFAPSRVSRMNLDGRLAAFTRSALAALLAYCLKARSGELSRIIFAPGIGKAMGGQRSAELGSKVGASNAQTPGKTG